MKKVYLVVLTVMAACFVFSGCGCKHEWKEATCTEPKTCALCGETEGEALGHTWKDATCEAPKTCTVCGTTEGEALPHTFTEANYQAPKTCSVCGATEGEPLQPDFEKYGLDCTIEPGVTYDYVTTCYEDTDYQTVGKLTIQDYQTIASDDEHEALDGYEWKIITPKYAFSDDNACNYGC